MKPKGNYPRGYYSKKSHHCLGFKPGGGVLPARICFSGKNQEKIRKKIRASTGFDGIRGFVFVLPCQMKSSYWCISILYIRLIAYKIGEPSFYSLRNFTPSREMELNQSVINGKMS